MPEIVLVHRDLAEEMPQGKAAVITDGAGWAVNWNSVLGESRSYPLWKLSFARQRATRNQIGFLTKRNSPKRTFTRRLAMFMSSLHHFVD